MTRTRSAITTVLLACAMVAAMFAAAPPADAHTCGSLNTPTFCYTHSHAPKNVGGVIPKGAPSVVESTNYVVWW